MPIHSFQPFRHVSGLTSLLLGLLLLPGCGKGLHSTSSEVVVYASQDQVYAEPILRLFEKETGIKVKSVFDSEAVKTVGLVQRLLAEAKNPQCDVFWSNEELRTHQLAARGVLRPTNGWTAFGYRSRRMVINTNHLPLVEAPRSLLELTNAAWKGKVSMAYPVFGSTATHLVALRASWGEDTWANWCHGMVANEPFLEAGNSHVPSRLHRGEAWIGLTDFDDFQAAGRQNLLPGHMLPVGADTLLIRNSIGIIHQAPNPREAQLLSDFLQRADIVERLVEAGALEGADPSELATETIKPEWPDLVRDLDAATEFMKTVFLK